jgi:hypothetical protein
MRDGPAGPKAPRSARGIQRRSLLAGGAAAALALIHRGAAARRPKDNEPAAGDALARAEGASEAEAAFSDVAGAGPDEVLRFLAGRHPRYPGADVDSLMGFSPADILETMDTDVLDTVRATRSGMALDRVYRIIAEQVLETMLSVYGERRVVLALDAGHGGRRGVFYDPGAGGTEAGHTRAVVELIEERAAAPRYRSLILRRIFNDEIGDDFGIPPPEDRKGAAALTIRNARGAMLAHEAAAWTSAHPDRPVAVHVVSVHFNAGSGGILVLHQGDSVPAEHRARSVEFARTYVHAARGVLNSSGLLPYPLRLALGTGLSDDTLLYEPPFRLSRVNPYTGADRSSFPRRYAMLQSSLLQRDYALGALVYSGLTTTTRGGER